MAQDTESNDHDPSTTQISEPYDLANHPHSLHRAVYARRAEFTRPKRLRLKIGTWNVAASPGTDKDVTKWFIDGLGIERQLSGLGLSPSGNSAVKYAEQPGEDVQIAGHVDVDLYVLGLQEVMTLNPVSQYVYADTNIVAKWKKALEGGMPPGYQCVAQEHMSGLVLLVYASPQLVPSISNISVTTVGTGVGGWLGNKGAAMARIELGETTRMVFVNSHLSSGNETAAMERRCWDARQIVDRAKFDPVKRPDGAEEAGAHIGEEDFAFWFGDLNFRLDGIPGEDTRRILTLHTTGEYDLDKAGRQKKPKSPSGGSDSSHDKVPSQVSQQDDKDDESTPLPDPDDFEPEPSEDPASLQATLNSLLSHDQLLHAMKKRTIFHDGWHEGPISFLPSYKYDTGEIGTFDTSEKARAPSWCDRILYRTRRDYEEHRQRKHESEKAKQRDAEMKARGMDHAADDDDVLFSYDPESDGDAHPQRAASSEYDEGEDDHGESVSVTEHTRRSSNIAQHDRIQLEVYTSHQKITTSDHKPVVAVFAVEYDAVVPELKAKVHAEVARELDRAENEGRPVVTVVVDHRGATPTGDAGADNGAVHFGDLYIIQRKHVSLIVANTGRAPATVSFVGKKTHDQTGGTDAEMYSTPAWLSTAFSTSDHDQGGNDDIKAGDDQVILGPGETIDVELEAFVDDIVQARKLNSGLTKLEDVLVLRVKDGRDHFIPVSAQWMPTCVGRSIEELIRVPDGGIQPFIRSLSEQKKKHVGSISYDLDVHCAAPKELFKLTETLETLTERVLADEHMRQDFTVPHSVAAWPFESSTASTSSDELELIAAVFAQLDNDKPILDALSPEITSVTSLEVVAKALTLFLEGLTDGVISVPLWSRLEQAQMPTMTGQTTTTSSITPQEDDKSTVLDVLSHSPHHNISFVFLTTALQKIIGELAPVSQAELAVLQPGSASSTSSVAISSILAKRPISFRRSTASSSTSSIGPVVSVADALAAADRRAAKEKKIAEILAPAVFRSARPMNGIFHTRDKKKEMKVVEEKQRKVLELFLRKSG